MLTEVGLDIQLEVRLNEEVHQLISQVRVPKCTLDHPKHTA